MAILDYKESAEEYVTVVTVQRRAQTIDEILPAKFRTDAYMAYISEEADKRGVAPGVVLAEELQAHEALKNERLWPDEAALIARFCS